jgi:signal transduction histidine kinase
VEAGPVRRLGGRADRDLAELVDVLSPVLHGLGLQAELEDQLAAAHAHAERIAAARRQAFAERDSERRDLERDLHDGAQHHLVALKMVVGLLEFQLGNGDRPAAGAALTRLRAGLEQTEQTLLSTAAGICPPVLMEQGIVAALAAEFRDLGDAVRVLANAPGRRLPLVSETAVYFTCLEAVNNARKHAPGAQVVVRLQEGPEGLAFAVTDNGPGVQGADLVDSFGLGNMRARIEAAGGRLDLYTAPGEGTTVHGLIPV